MSIAVIGGIKRLETHYRREASKRGINLVIFNVASRDMDQKLRRMDAVILFTGQVSHNARTEVIRAARRHQIPIYQHHSCGICTLRDCLDCCLDANKQIQA